LTDLDGIQHGTPLSSQDSASYCENFSRDPAHKSLKNSSESFIQTDPPTSDVLRTASITRSLGRRQKLQSLHDNQKLTVLLTTDRCQVLQQQSASSFFPYTNETNDCVRHFITPTVLSSQFPPERLPQNMRRILNEANNEQRIKPSDTVVGL